MLGSMGSTEELQGTVGRWLVPHLVRTSCLSLGSKTDPVILGKPKPYRPKVDTPPCNSGMLISEDPYIALIPYSRYSWVGGPPDRRGAFQGLYRDRFYRRSDPES